MNSESTSSMSSLLASAITPVGLITGVAFLTSIMAPRFGRCIDHIRRILAEMKSLPVQGREHENNLLQLKILYRRTRTLRNTMTAAGICILFVVFTIVSTFSNILFGTPGSALTLLFFLTALFWLLVLTLGFIFDFMRSLQAVKLEIECGLDPSGKEAREVIR